MEKIFVSMSTIDKDKWEQAFGKKNPKKGKTAKGKTPLYIESSMERVNHIRRQQGKEPYYTGIA